MRRNDGKLYVRTRGKEGVRSNAQSHEDFFSPWKFLAACAFKNLLLLLFATPLNKTPK